jgi:outer membrane autotransporter protein
MSLPQGLTVVTALPSFSKTFTPVAVSLGGPTTLLYTINNTLSANRIGSLSFTETLPTGIRIATPANASTDCISANVPNTILTAAPGGSTIALNAVGFNFADGFEVLPPGASCTVSVDVIAAGVGMLSATSGPLLADGISAGVSSAVLVVTATELAISKTFLSNPVNAGGTTTLRFTIENFNRTFSATNVNFTDNLSVVLTGLTFNSLISNDCGGSVSGVGGTLIGFSGGVIALGSACTIEASLTVPASAASATFTNITSDVTGTVDGNLITGDPAVAVLTIAPGDGSVNATLNVLTAAPVAGDPITVQFTIDNTSPTNAVTDLGVILDLIPPLPFPAQVTLPPVPNPPCGAGSSLALISLGFNDQGLELSAGTIPAGSSCSFTAILILPGDLPGGNYNLTTNAPTATLNGASITGSSGSASFTVAGGLNLNFAKSFSNTATPGGTVDLTFSITGSGDSGAAQNINFTDDLAPVLAGLSLSAVTVNQCGGTLSGTTLLSYTGGTLAAGASCDITVTLNVPAAAAAGNFTNTTSLLSAEPAGGGTPVTFAAASAVLSVARLEFTKQFIGNPVIAGDTLSLRYTITNQHPTLDATSAVFTDSLAAALTGLAATGAPTANTCGGSLSGTTFLIYNGGTVTAGTSCTIDVPLLVPAGAADGNYSSATSTLTATQGGSVVVSPAFDTLTVQTAQLQLTKAFTDDPVAPGAAATLEFTVDNLSTTTAATNIAFTDDLAAMLTGTTFGSVLSNNCGASLTGTGSTSISVAGGALAAGGSCVIRVSTTIPASAVTGTYINTTSGLTGTIGSFAVTGDVASDNLVVAAVGAPVFSKAFTAPVQPSGTAQLTFTIDNSDAAAVARTGLNFNDDLDAMLSGATLGGATTNTCGGTLGGSSLLAYTGGSVAAGATCTIVVDVAIPATAPGGSFVNTTSDLTTSGLLVAGPASANLTVEPAPTFAKAFGPASIAQGGTSTLTFTIDNSASSFAVAALAFTDNLPAAVTVAASPASGNTCGGSLTAAGGSGTISLTGGSLAAGASCTLNMTVTSVTIGSHINTTGDLTSSAGNSGPASGTLAVTAAPAPTFAKAFGPNPILPTLISTLTFTIDNTASLLEATSLDFSDAFPAGLVIAPTPNNSSTCTGGMASVAPGGGSFGYSGGTVAAGATCTVQVDVTAAAQGNYTNVSGALTSSLGNSGTATDTLVVSPVPVPGFSKSFLPASIVQNGVTTLTFTIDNTASPIDATSVDFADIMPAGLTIATPANSAATCTGGTLTAVSGSGALTYRNGTALASTSCTVNVDVTSATPGNAVNTTSDLTSSLGNSGPATATLIVTAIPAPGFSQAFMPSTIFQNGVSSLVFTIDNTAAMVAASALNFSNTLPANVTVAATPNATTTCGGSVTATAGTNSLALSGGSVGASSTCQVSVDVTSTVAGTYPNTPGNLSSSLGSSTPGAASLTVNVDPRGQVTFIQQSANDAPFGFSSAEATLNFTINTVGGTGSSGPISVPTGSHTVTQSGPAGAGIASITCSDNDSTGDAATGVITLNVAAFETLTCTISSVDSRQKAVDTINSFLNRRNNLILSNQPNRARRMDRLRTGGTGVQRLSYQNGDLESMLPFSANFQTLASGNLEFSTSVTKAATGHAKFLLAHDGEPESTRMIYNHKFDVWLEASHNNFNASQGSGGHFTIGYLGADYLVNPKLLAGVLVQYDELLDASAQTNSRVKGKGWMIGPYITTQLAPNLYFDGRVAYGKSRNRISPFNTYTDTFRTDRWMVNANLSGNYDLENWQISPNINLAYIEENQHAYVDSLNVGIPSQTVGLGQLRFGPDFSTVIYGANHSIIEPRITIDGIYNFGNRSGNPLVNNTSNEADGWRARIETDVSITNRHGTQLQLGVNYDGIGQSNFESYGVSFKVTISLN